MAKKTVFRKCISSFFLHVTIFKRCNINYKKMLVLNLHLKKKFIKIDNELTRE